MKKISLKRVIKKIFNRTGVTIMASVFLCAIGIGGGFGIAKLVRPQTIADETITLPDGSAFDIQNESATNSSFWEASASLENGSGTELDPYLISTPQELAYLAEKAKTSNGSQEISGSSIDTVVYYKLTEDLDLSKYLWDPIGKYSVKYIAFDGGAHTVSGVFIDTTNTSYGGLFSTLYNCSIKNLNIKKVKVETSRTYTGALCGFFLSGKIENVSAEELYVDGGFYVGGIVGSARSSSVQKVSVTNSSIKGNNYIGGIAGEGAMFFSCSFKNSIINTKLTSNSYISGICAYSTTSSERTVFINCRNECDISSSTSEVSGICSYPQNYEVIIKSCSNTGDLTGKIAFGITNNCNASTKKFVIKDCYNTGDINANSYASGIVGEFSCFYSSSVLENCYNIGNVSSNYRPSGIISKITCFVNVTDNNPRYRTVKNCYNVGEITLLDNESSNNKSGGIIAHVYFNSYCNLILDGCYTQKGSVYGTKSSVATVIAETSEVKENLSELVKIKNNYMTDNENLAWNDGTNWDFESVWTIDETGTINNGYPYLLNSEGVAPLFCNGEELLEKKFTKKDFSIMGNSGCDNLKIYYRETIGSVISEWKKYQDGICISVDGVYDFYCTYGENDQYRYPVEEGTYYSIIRDDTVPEFDFSENSDNFYVVNSYGGSYSGQDMVAWKPISFSVSDNLSENVIIKYKTSNNTTLRVMEVNDEISVEDGVWTITPNDNSDWFILAYDEAGNESKRFSIGFRLESWMKEEYSEEPTGSGVESDPYIVSEATEFAYIAQNHSGYTYIEIVNDIDLSAHIWVPLFVFNGSIEGNNHTISGLKVPSYTSLIKSEIYGKVGLIGYSNSQLVIKNLTLSEKDSQTITGYEAVGSFVGDCLSVVLKNCENRIRIAGDGGYKGGLIGECRSDYHLENCRNKAVVAGSSSIGGLIGYFNKSNSSRQCDVYNCLNEGSISSNTGGGSSGGLIGYHSGSNITVKNSYNFGKITGNGYMGACLEQYSQRQYA